MGQGLNKTIQPIDFHPKETGHFSVKVFSNEPDIGDWFQNKLRHWSGIVKKRVFLFVWRESNTRSTVFFRPDGYFREFQNEHFSHETDLLLVVAEDEVIRNQLFVEGYDYFASMICYQEKLRNITLLKAKTMVDIPLSFFEWINRQQFSEYTKSQSAFTTRATNFFENIIQKANPHTNIHTNEIAVNQQNTDEIQNQQCAEEKLK